MPPPTGTGSLSPDSCRVRRMLATEGVGQQPKFRSEVRLKPPASDQASSYHSDAGRERQEGPGPDFSPNRPLLAAFEGAKHMVRMVFDDIIVDTAPLRAVLWARFNVNIRHAVLSPGSFR